MTEDEFVAFVEAAIPEFARRHQGHATRAFLRLEEEVRQRGLAGIALHVFGHNTGAQCLYEQLGFSATNINMFKAVGPRNIDGNSTANEGSDSQRAPPRGP